MTCLGVLASALPFVGGCYESGNGGSGLIATASAETPTITATATNPPPTATTATPVVSGGSGAPTETALPAAAPASADAKPLPPNIRPSSPLAEVVKLAQAGVDHGVILTFITNSTGTFNLDSDGIIYLNDIGLPNEAVTAMLDHDAAMKHVWADAPATAAPAAPQSTAVEETTAATAPTYVNPPQAAPAESQPATVNYNYFYDTLSPYGSWINVDGYGMCWQPSVVVLNRGWRPYCDGGRWLYTDSGWYWYSDYTWGWAPFHYGRWFNHPSWGWCWNPGYTWGPAWVNWRYNDGYCGWAPLPPAAYYSTGVGFTWYGSSVSVGFGFGLGWNCYTFVPWGNFYGYRPYKHCLPRHHTETVYKNSTVINNYVVGNNNTIINGGIAPKKVSTYTKTEIRPVVLRDLDGRKGGIARREQLDRDGRTLSVHRPRLPEASTRSEIVKSGGRRTEPKTPATTATAPLPKASGVSSANSILTPATPTANTRQPAVRMPERRAPAPTKTFPAPAPATPAPTSIAGQEQSSPSPSPTQAAKDGKSRGLAPAKSARPSEVTIIGKSDRTDTRTTTPAPQVPTRNQSTQTISRGTPVQKPPPVVSQPQPKPAPSASPQNTVRRAPELSYNWTAPSAAPSQQATPQRQEIPRITRSMSDRPANRGSQPVYSSPSPTPAPSAPSYSAPAPSHVTPKASPMPAAPSYSAPASSPHRFSPPAYSAPPARSHQPSPAPAPQPSARPAPAPAQPSAPAQSSSSRSEPSRRGNGRN